VRVAVVAEYYPRSSDPALGVWAHRQALAVRAQGVDVQVLALHRPIPPLSTVRAGPAAMRRWLRDSRGVPASADLDGIRVRYVRFLSPPRPLTYETWGRWAAPPLGRALDELHARWPFDLVHAHYAVPAGDAVVRWMDRRGPLPLAVSVHGGDLSFEARRPAAWAGTVSRTLSAADAVIANSAVTVRGIRDMIGASARVETIHLGADLREAAPHREDPALVTVGHLIPRKNQAVVIRALAALRARHPQLRYVVIGDGPERDSLAHLAQRLGVADGVDFLGSLPHDRALEEMARCHVHALPSSDEPFGVAHIEAMGAGLVAIGGTGTGAEDIAAAGEGIVLVPPGDETALARELDRLIADAGLRARLADAARATVAASFTWERNGERTAALYRELVQAGRKGAPDGS
jgi:glycosyltransferase involved in cell wall biosynthesis